jgi:hypothetical protein
MRLADRMEFLALRQETPLKDADFIVYINFPESPPTSKDVVMYDSFFLELSLWKACL